MKNNRILALSGNDIFSGGGLSADLATYTLNGLHGFVAVTCLTSLTEKGFEVFLRTILFFNMSWIVCVTWTLQGSRLVFSLLSVWLRRHWTLSSNVLECRWYWTPSWSARKPMMWQSANSVKS